MNLQKRIDLLIRLGEYILSDSAAWQQAKQKAEEANKWFTSLFIETATTHIAKQFLNAEKISHFINGYHIPDHYVHPRTVGIVMAGNIPLVGFHDWVCTFLAGHKAMIKTSSKDDVLIRHLIEQMYDWEPSIKNSVSFAELLKGCNAYIATGSNNSARYFDYYFGKYPNIIRRNRTSVAILTGEESSADLKNLSDDVHLYFGLGCRNVTKIYVPADYNFQPLLAAFDDYAYFINHATYKNNYDYQLAIHLINHKYYMTNGSILLSQNTALFSPISQLNYEFYTDPETVERTLQNNPEIQCIAGNAFTRFGQTQFPALSDYADGVDTMKFLLQSD